MFGSGGVLVGVDWLYAGHRVAWLSHGPGELKLSRELLSLELLYHPRGFSTKTLHSKPVCTTYPAAWGSRRMLGQLTAWKPSVSPGTSFAAAMLPLPLHVMSSSSRARWRAVSCSHSTHFAPHAPRGAVLLVCRTQPGLSICSDLLL